MDRSISATHGINKVLQNIGKTANKGVDLGLSTINIQMKDFSWSSDGTLSINRNKIVDLYGDGKDDINNQWFIGKPIDVSYGYKFGGVWQLNEAGQIPSSPQPLAQPGYAKVVDVTGDGTFSSADKMILGNLNQTLLGD